MKVLAIDPGLSGAIAIVVGKPEEYRVEAVHDLPTTVEKTSSGKLKRKLDPVLLNRMVKEMLPVDLVICERMIAPPGISGLAAMSMGITVGTISTVLKLAKVDLKLVSANVWKRGLDVSADKESARLHASRLFKSDEFWVRKKDHNRAEAALIGLWGLMSGKSD